MKDTINIIPVSFLKFSFVIFSLILLIYLFRPDRNLPSQPLEEDAFYMFSVSRNLAEGNGVRYEGGVLTNGFQPLITFLYVPIFFLAGRHKVYLPLRFILFFNLIIYLLSAYLVGRIGVILSGLDHTQSSHSLQALIMLLWAGSYFLFRLAFSGLETGLYFLVLAALTLFILRQDKELRRGNCLKEIWLGLFLGIAVLTRIDAGFLSVSLSLYLVCLHWQQGKGLLSVRPLWTVGFVSLLVSSPWWIYNKVCFGSFMPISGIAERQWGVILSTNLLNFFHTIIQAVSLQVPGTHLPLTFVPLLFLTGGIAIFFFLKRDYFSVSPAYKGWFIPLAFFYLILIIYYVFMQHAAQFIYRFLAPMYIIWVPLLGIFLYNWYSRSSTAFSLPAVLVVAFIMIGLGLQGMTITHKGMASWTWDRHYNGLLVKHNINTASRVGAFSSGVLGYFHQNVVNLDGKVNPDALRAIEEHRLPRYILDSNIDYLLDLAYFDEYFFGSTKKSKHFTLVDEFQGAALWQRVKD